VCFPHLNSAFTLDYALALSTEECRLPLPKRDFRSNIPLRMLLLPEAFLPISADKSEQGVNDVLEHDR